MTRNTALSEGRLTSLLHGHGAIHDAGLRDGRGKAQDRGLYQLEQPEGIIDGGYVSCTMKGSGRVGGQGLWDYHVGRLADLDPGVEQDQDPLAGGRQLGRLLLLERHLILRMRRITGQTCCTQPATHMLPTSSSERPTIQHIVVQPLPITINDKDSPFPSTTKLS